jgi:glycosyltransferase involved in cell wall biosynthesis
VDDGSADGSWQTICRFASADARVKAMRHESNRGASRSRNDGLRAAKGDFLGFCDSDDIWEPDKLRFQLDLLQKGSGYDVAYCDASIINEGGSPTGHRFSERFPPPKVASGWLFQELVGRNFVNMQCVLMRKECVQRSGYFDEEIKWVEDWWYWVRLSRHHRFLYSPEPLARYRVHRGSTNVAQKRGYHVNRFKVFRRILQKYPDLSRHAKADIIYKMAVDLCEAGKRRNGRRLLWDVVRLSLTDLQGFANFARAMRRLTLSAADVRSPQKNWA